MAKIPTISQQMFGDVNERLNVIRAKMNAEVHEKYEELQEKKKKKV